jgi:DNA-binding IclR family transcriptional regulator
MCGKQGLHSIVTEERKKRAGIQSVEIGMRVLETLASLGRPRPLAAVVKGCGLSPSQTHRYLASLIEAGMVIQDARGDYDLGPSALKLGLSALARIDIFRIADTMLENYCIETGSTVLLAALGPAGPTIVRWHVGNPPIVTSLALGSVLSLVESATGQVFLAFRPAHEVSHLLDRELRAKGAPDKTSVEKLRSKVRSEGQAKVGGTLIPGLHALAFPILDLQNSAAFAATRLSLVDRRNDADQRHEERLEEVCREISTMLGASPSLPSF